MTPRILVAALFALVFALGACSESDTSLDDAGADDAVTDGEGGDGEGGDGDLAAEQRADAIELLVSQGISEDGAECMVDDVIDQGIDPADLDQMEGFVIDPEIQEAVAFASAACLDADDIAGLPDEALDLTNPIVRREFVESFSITSGLTIEQSECVVDELIAADFDARDAFGSGTGDIDPETARLIGEAVETCV